MVSLNLLYFSAWLNGHGFNFFQNALMVIFLKFLFNTT